ncbi:unnamed protein product [Fraxinus pennsylvanica]|uniref:Alpha-glucosidase n=1 Tax=Fraxinus pennsylvanica TaxID=56036 RepID=A0AAD2E1U3_9LAMI|nr:unnamed protein product [Fraxinus pennsylvanica]
MAKNKGTTCSKVQSREMLPVPILEKGVFRFDCSVHDRNNASPSISFKNPKCRDTPITNCHVNPTYTPTFECVMGEQRVNIELPSGTSFYGTGEVSGQLERTGKRIFTWNTDAYLYTVETTSLYQSHPWILAVLPDGKALGVLADTTRRCEIDLTKESNIKIISPSSYPLIIFGPFSSPADVLMSFSRAIGTAFMPPKWSLGYQQSRWSYDSDARVREIARTFREKKIPCDVIWMDIDYMDGFRCFTFDKDRFSDPKSLVDYLHQNGFKANWMLDPGIKHEEGYFVYDSGSKRDIWVQTASQKPFVGKVWPGPCVFPDFTKSEARSWWASLVKDFVTNGVDGLWNDMNEPAVMETQTKTMPESNIHRGDPEYGGKQNHSHYHNVYGMLMARSTYEGVKLSNEQKRPFVLTRAGYVGSQRYAATWTGDNASTWPHLHMSIPMVLNLGLSGQPISGPDIGGFSGNATPKLFGRWMGVGAMFPFCRGHSIRNSVDHEPWSFGEECEEVCRLALRRRYQLLPHIYNLFYLAHTVGIPVATPTFFADPKDIELRKQENSFLLGPLLVYASTTEDQVSSQLLRKLPKGIWMSFDFEDYHPDLPSLYLKGGSIIPLAPPYQHVGEANRTDDITLPVALDEHGKAEGFLYEDAGDGYEYLEGKYLLTTCVAELQSFVVTLKVLKSEGSWDRPKRRLNVKLLISIGAVLDAWGTDGEVVQIKFPTILPETVSRPFRLAHRLQFSGEVWPGPCVFPDFTMSEARSWWGSLVKDFVTNGVDGLWNDMNEPALLKTETKTMPESNIHRGDLDYGGKQNHSHYHNVYGMLMARSTYEGMKLANEQKRPFVLTRAGFVGSQRYAATWTGDNVSTWQHLHMSIPMVLNLGLSGQPYSGPDIGGFIGNATPKLFGRWMGVGAMFPFCRGHSDKRSVDHEPWSFGKECEEVCRLALRRRYQLLPHIYNLFYLAHTLGIPVATPTFFADPKDIELRKQENSFLLGPLLVCASTTEDQVSSQLLRKLPKGIWMSFDFEDYHPDLPSLYLKGGSIIPLAPPYQHVGEANRTDDITLLVALDENGKAEGFLYEDDGDGYEYLEGKYLLTTYVAELQSSVVTLKVLKSEGSWNRPKRRLNVKLLICIGAVLDAWGTDGEVVQIKFPTGVGAE